MKTYSNPNPDTWGALCTRPTLSIQKLDALMCEIFTEVARDGDTAVRAYAERFDRCIAKDVVVQLLPIEEEAQTIPVALRKAIDSAYDAIALFHAAQKRPEISQKIETVPGVTCWRETRPIEKVGLYVPGGSAPLISTMLMLGIPAQLAGCTQIIVCTPPDATGTVQPALRYAAAKIGAKQVFCIGGAQAIAAMAIGTQSVPRVDKIFGPGNQYVTAAKEYAGRYNVAIDMPAGPSEVLVIADEQAVASVVAADLLSQAEHGPDSQVVLLTTYLGQLSAVQKEIKRQVELLPRRDIAKKALNNSFSVYFDRLDDAIDFANTYAPEHIILNVTEPEQLVPRVINAGSVFLGSYTPESAGDYASGTNHTLPTNGWARSCSGVSLDSFVRQVTFQSITKEGIAQLAPTIQALADAEGLQAHARAVSIRLG